MHSLLFASNRTLLFKHLYPVYNISVLHDIYPHPVDSLLLILHNR